jgi:hypothetical protein
MFFMVKTWSVQVLCESCKCLKDSVLKLAEPCVCISAPQEWAMQVAICSGAILSHSPYQGQLPGQETLPC